MSGNKGFRFVLPEDSLAPDDARLMAHVVVIGAVLTLGLFLAASIVLMAASYWGG